MSLLVFISLHPFFSKISHFSSVYTSFLQYLYIELILEQVECADYILINKIDLLSSDQELALVSKVLTSINPTAKLFSCSNGKIDPLLVVGSAGGMIFLFTHLF